MDTIEVQFKWDNKAITMYEDATKYVNYTDLKWSGILKSVSKSTNKLQPLFEAFTNSLEAISLRQRNDDAFEPYITVVLDFGINLFNEPIELKSILIEDNGVGFDSENYSRLRTYKDDTKGFNNRGSGRIQMIHSFSYVNVNSTFSEDAETMNRKFTLSKSNRFISKNTILYEDESPSIVTGEQVRTVLRMDKPLKSKDATEYAEIKCVDLKEELIHHYLLYFCSNKDYLPEINIVYLYDSIEKEREQITHEDIPSPTHDDVTITVPLCKMSEDMKRVEELEDECVEISIVPFRISSEILPKSEIIVTSKGEISETNKIKMTCISPEASLENHRYLFLLKSEYFDNLESDERGNIEILDKTEFKKVAQAHGDIDEQIVLNDIEEAVNKKASEIYEEISIQNQRLKERLDQLKKDYLLSEEALKGITNYSNIEDVFKKAYDYDAKIMAQENAKYESAVQDLNYLDPSSDDYQSKLKEVVDDFVESIPVKNRVTLTNYVVRRKMVTDLMGKILNRELVCQDESIRNMDEALLHNLLFKQHSNNPLTSDLWIINEEFMYFKGTSESLLFKVEIDGNRIFRDEFEEEEKRYLRSLGENRELMRADVLLFPSEGKCVIIEFKNPNVNVADHLNQINKYAYFLRNFTKPDYNFLTFYGYLIGESIENRDVRSADGDFKFAPNLDYLFRPAKNVPDDSNSSKDGTLYTEIIQFSVLKERAELRNKAFIDCLKSTEGKEEL